MTTVLHVQPGSGTSGGIANYIRALIQSASLARYAFSITVPTVDSFATEGFAGAELVELPSTYSPVTFLGYLWRLYLLVRTKKVNVLHAHALRAALPAVLIGTLAGVPVVYTNHGLRFSQKTTRVSRSFFQLIERVICRYAFAVCSIRISDHSLLSTLETQVRSKLRLIETRISDIAAVPRTQAPNHPTVVGIGTLIPVKRPDRFIKWVAAIQAKDPTVRAIWLGDGPLMETMRGLAADLGAAIEFRGDVSRAEVFDVLSEATLLLLTSDFEVMPLCVLESYACGTPVVATRFRGVEDFVLDAETGIIIDDECSPDWDAELLALIRDRTVYAEMSRSARARFLRDFQDPETMARQYAELYRSATNLSCSLS